MAINLGKYQSYFDAAAQEQPNRKSELDSLRSWSPEAAGAANTLKVSVAYYIHDLA